MYIYTLYISYHEPTNPLATWGSWGGVRNGFKVGAGMGYTMMVGLFLIAANGVVGGGFKYFLFSPPPGEMIQFD